jgi:preprotein translocase subunit SecA
MPTRRHNHQRLSPVVSTRNDEGPTRSVEASESVARELAAGGVGHVVLNARQDAHEAEVVRAAGEPGSITVATNMAGRGTDIKLKEAARQAGGLHVILTEFHDSARVDRQLLGRCGRQGDPGTTRAIVSLQDSLLKNEPAPWRWAVKSTQGRPWQNRILQWGITRAQRQAGRRAYRARLATLKQDRELNQLIGFAGKTL